MMIYIQGENTLIPLTLDLSNYYTKEEIEEAIANIDLSQYALVSEVEANKIITDAHIDNNDIHITSEEREKWNSGISSSGVSQEYVDTAIANLVDSAPDTLNTLNELAVAIQENDSIIGTLNTAITNKADKNDLDSHIDNDEIHITAAERETWNNTQTKITGIPGQFVVIGDDGNVTTKTIPYAEEASF